MRRVLVLAPQVAVAILVGVAAGLLWLARGDETGTGPAPAEAVTATGVVTPETHAFGDRVLARVDVVVDNRTVDPGSVRVETDFAPYQAAGQSSVERWTVGARSVVRFSYPLRCLGEGCDPTGAASTVEFELGRVLYRFRQQSGDAVEVLDWPPFTVTGRVGATAVDDILWRASPTALAAPTYRTSPTGLAALLLAAAVLLGSLGAWLAWRLWRPRRVVTEESEAVVLARTALERALDSARDASRNGDPGLRRRALERVSRELDAVGLHALAVDATLLAWRPTGPSEGDVDDLARRSAAQLAGGAAT